MSIHNFANLPIYELKTYLMHSKLYQNLLEEEKIHSTGSWVSLKQQWHHLHKTSLRQIKNADLIETLEVDWLMSVFNKAFSQHSVTLVRSENEPEYFPASNQQPARISFAHGFFQSALHEISHWCIAGAYRRTLSDFGYWYAPDGRTEIQQKAFEHVEIKPQAIECLFSLICHKSFMVSQDNLHANFDTSKSTFKVDVFQQAKTYINDPQSLPIDAKSLMTILTYLCHENYLCHDNIEP